MAGVEWGLVVPVKRLGVAKTRLAGYGDRSRQDLALAFALDVVAAALACPVVVALLVVTDDVRAASALQAAGARIVLDGPDAGLNPALEHGAALLAADRSLGLASLVADLPSLRSAELASALATVPPGGRALVADAAGIGTTLLAAAPGVALAPAYGGPSRAGHLRSGAVELAGGPGLRLDVDTPEDLRAALALGVGPSTAAAAAGLRE